MLARLDWVIHRPRKHVWADSMFDPPTNTPKVRLKRSEAVRLLKFVAFREALFIQDQMSSGGNTRHNPVSSQIDGSGCFEHGQWSRKGNAKGLPISLGWHSEQRLPGFNQKLSFANISPETEIESWGSGN